MSEQKWIGEDGPQEMWVFLDQGTNVVGYSETGPELARPNERAVHFTRAPQWQPIESAPKDGTWVLIWEEWNPERKHRNWTISRFIRGKWSNSQAYQGPSHWMPMPAAPEAEG